MPLYEVPMPPTTPDEFVQGLEEQGGDMVAFCTKYSPTDNHCRWLFQVKTKVETNPALHKRWKKAIDRHAEIALDYTKAQVLEQLEVWLSDPEAKGLAGKVAYAKVILADIIGSRLEGAKRRASHPFLRDLRDAGASSSEDVDEDKELDDLERELTA